jgi:hypothetical protein
MGWACEEYRNGALPADGDGETLYVPRVSPHAATLDMEGSINTSPVSHSVKDG